MGLLWVAVLGGGCARLAENRKVRLLEAAVEGYRQALRWGDGEALLGFVVPEQRAAIDLSPLAAVQVVGYEVVRPPLLVAADRAEQIARIDYVRRDRQRLTTFNDRQDWRYDPARATWWLHSLPPFAHLRR